MEEKQYYTAEEIHYIDNGIWTLGNDDLRNLISITLIKIPKNIVDDLSEKAYFLIIEEYEKGSYFHNGFFNNKCLICFSDKYIKSDVNFLDIEHTILHEVAHFSLEHKNPITNHLSPEEYDLQEKAANDLVDKWLEEWNSWAKAKMGG